MPRPHTVLLLSLAVAGCSLGGGSSKSGGPPADHAAAHSTITLRFSSADQSAVAPTFIAQLARVSGGRLRAVLVRYDDQAADVDQQIARDLAAGRIDVADVAARAWESLGATGMRAFQSPFLITSDALLDRTVADPGVATPLLRSLAPLGVTGLALTPRGVRYLFSRRALDRPEDFAGARVRINESATTAGIVTGLGARPVPGVDKVSTVLAQLRAGELDAVEANMKLGVANGYVRVAPHLSPPLFAKVTTLAVNSKRLAQLGPRAAGWIREAAALAAAAERARDDHAEWASACGAGVAPAATTPDQLDALDSKELNTNAELDFDPAAALAIDRIGLLATESPRADPWARCHGSVAASPTAAIDGTYEVTVTPADLDRAGTSPGNDGRYRFQIGNGRLALLHLTDTRDPEMPGWDFNRDPVLVSRLLVHGDRVHVRPTTSIGLDAVPLTLRYELFRDRLRWRLVDGPADAVEWLSHPWRRVR
jgi:TRAP-type C4-dicarboxylate transport system substrate-binding protein